MTRIFWSIYFIHTMNYVIDITLTDKKMNKWNLRLYIDKIKLDDKFTDMLS